MKWYIVNWKVRNDGMLGHQSSVLDEAEKDALVASLKSDPDVYNINVKELENE